MNFNLETFKVSSKMNLIPEDGAYMLIIDSKLPIQSIVLQSKQNVDILKIKDNIAKIYAVKETQDPSIQMMAQLVIEGEGNQNVHNRIEIKIRTSEGQQGNINALIIPKDSQACQNIEIPLKPLNLHQKIEEFQPEESMLLNKIIIKAKNLDLEDSLMWLQNILPDVPSFVDDRKPQVVFAYKSSFIGSVILVTIYQPKMGVGELMIQTDNYSVLTIMKVRSPSLLLLSYFVQDQITTQANSRNIQLNIDSDF